MDREIKFKAWDNANKIWFNPDNVVLTTEGKAFHKYLHYDLSCLEIVSFTGLKDKNGVEIYEGDIVRILYSDWASMNEGDTRTIEEYLRDIGCIKIVIWSFNGFYVSHKKDGYAESMGVGEHGYIEIIGNIYENPELLNGGKK